VVVTAQEVQQPNYDCRTGCSLDSNINGPPVCGIDKLTYLNECLAVCQNVAIVHYGPCDQDGSISESELSTDSEVVTMELMTRFISRGYRFVSKNTKFLSQPENVEETVVVSEAESAAAGVVEDIEPYFVLFTPDGYEYAYRATDSLPSYPGPTPLYMGMQQLRQRNLAIIGADTRTPISNTQAYPYRTIGEADFGTLEGGCTLTMISRNAAITAGHCVYNYQNRVPIQMQRIAPGRYRDSSGNTVEPFGTWEVETMQTFGQFKSTGNMTFDMAVVTFQPETRDNMQNCPYVYPGDVVGFLSLDRAQTSGGRISDSRLASSTITGYPADFPNGVMATSGTCSKGKFFVIRGSLDVTLKAVILTFCIPKHGTRTTNNSPTTTAIRSAGTRAQPSLQAETS
jgi:V8-like Glu-specific endopeptidase